MAFWAQLMCRFLVSVLILVLFIIVLYGICWKLIEKGRGLRS